MQRLLGVVSAEWRGTNRALGGGEDFALTHKILGVATHDEYQVRTKDVFPCPCPRQGGSSAVRGGGCASCSNQLPTDGNFKNPVRKKVQGERSGSGKHVDREGTGKKKTHSSKRKKNLTMRQRRVIREIFTAYGEINVQSARPQWRNPGRPIALGENGKID